MERPASPRTGPGWQSRINAALRKAAKLPAEKKRATGMKRKRA
ncbi:MAG: BrnA antitoxin family protein [Bradyrhizobiaceae bacterium]|nr:BrnA antitoxin family protein [Bradyrhizobiaceae bacterium]